MLLSDRTQLFSAKAEDTTLGQLHSGTYLLHQGYAEIPG